MNSIQRAWRSVIRKPMKSILLLFVVLTVSLFLFSGMASQNASVQTQDVTRQAVGAGLRLDANEAYRSKQLTEISEKIGADTEGFLDGVHQEKLETAYGTQWITWTDNSFESLRIDDIEEIAAVDGISDYNITTSMTAVNPVNFSRVEDTDTDQSSDIGGVVLIGNLNMELDSNVLSGNVTIKEGRMVTENDMDVCVISEELAAQDGLSVGDILQFNDYHDPSGSTVYEAEIIGIYQTQQQMSPLMSGDTWRSENVIFTDLRFPEKAEGSENDPCFEHAYFQVGDVDQYDEVKAAVQNVDIDWEQYDLIDRNGDISTMSSNFNDLEKMSSLLIVVTVLASFVILFLIFLFWVKNRSREIGILLSLGTKKISILGQLFLEAILIAAFAFSISLIASPGVSNMAANYLVAQQVEQAELQKNADANKVLKSIDESEQTVTGVEVVVTGEMMAICGTSIVLLVGASVGAAGLSVLQKKPREILNELS